VLVVIANDLPPAIRGRMKLWFVEPRPNVFVSGVNEKVANNIVKMLLKHCPPKSGMILFNKIKQPPGFEIKFVGQPPREIIDITGMQLIAEKQYPV
jgi:CRISPR-associated protein Cas2